MAAGRVVVASRLGGLQEIIRDGETGHLVEPGDSEHLASRLDLALNNECLRISVGSQARSYVFTHLNSEQWFRQHLDVYASVLDHATTQD